MATNYLETKKGCRFCREKINDIDYKDIKLISKFLLFGGRIDPRRRNGNCVKHQHKIAQAIKRARIIALLPFVKK